MSNNTFASQQHICELAVCFPHTRLLTAEVSQITAAQYEWADMHVYNL
jgi:hypothetical protein